MNGTIAYDPELGIPPQEQRAVIALERADERDFSRDLCLYPFDVFSPDEMGEVQRDSNAARADAHQRARILEYGYETLTIRHEVSGLYMRDWHEHATKLADAASRQEAIGNGQVTS